MQPGHRGRVTNASRLVDVAVVGGGPAGAAAAITLARAGHSVVIIDKATFPRDKFCGDGLTAGALRLLEDLGLRPSSVPSWQPVHDVVVASPSGRSVTFPLPRGDGIYAAVARRVELDAALLNLARSAGAAIHEGHAVIAAEERSDRIVIGAAGLGEIHARHAIAADGMWSPMRKLLGVATPGYLGEWHAFRQYYADVGPSAAQDLFVWFEPDLLPGYVWSFPLPDGRANVGFGIQRDGGKIARVQDMKRLWPELLDRPHIRAVLGPNARPESPHRAWPIPARIDEVALTTARTLFVGDAAAATDAMTGEGIGQALLTGVLAARAISTGSDGAVVRSTYTDSVHRALVADHKMSLLLIRALKHRKGARAAVRIAGLTPWTRRNFARWLFEDYPRAILVTPRRWRRHLLTGPGAFRR